MNISKDGRTLYFSDEEIDNDTNGEKKVFVTKRINGKESHVKAEKVNPKQQKRKETNDDETFNFNNEIVIGVNVVEEKEKKNNQKGNKKRKKSKKNNKEKNKINYQKPKKKKPHKKILAFVSSILLIAIVIILALTAPIFNITDIQVQGNEKLDTNTIITLSGLKKGKNIFQFNANAMIQNIKENTYVQSAKIVRKLPGTVFITIEERQVKYQINFINSYAYLDKNGYILENSTVKQEVPVLVRFNSKRR